MLLVCIVDLRKVRSRDRSFNWRETRCVQAKFENVLTRGLSAMSSAGEVHQSSFEER